MKFSAMSRMISEKFQVVSTRIFDDMQIFSTSQLKEDFCTENSVLYFTDSFYRVNTETLQGSFLWYGDGPETLSSFSANWIQVRELKRSASSLSRELSRNKISHRPYSPSRAQRRYQRCKKNCGRKPILADQGNLQLIRRLLREEWSPEEIQYRLKHEKNSLQISYTTIYRALSSGQIDEYSPAISANATAMLYVEYHSILLPLIHHGSVKPTKTPTVCFGNISRKKHPLMMFPILSLRTLLQKSIFTLANALTGFLPLRSSLTPCCT